MSNRWYYEIDGQILGPVEQTRLRLLADSGMLQPHHQVRREDQTSWSPAATIRGLMMPATAPVNRMPVASPVPAGRAIPVAPAAPDEPPFGSWSEPTSDAPVPTGVFDFFGDEPTPPPPSPRPAQKAVKTPK